jgi:hypothetical protein
MITHIRINGKKLFAIIDEYNYITDCWMAYNLEEAQRDNPGCTVRELLPGESPFQLGKIYKRKDNVI